MKRLFKCKFCSLVSTFRTELFEHIKLAHQDQIIEELFYDDDQKSLEEIQEEVKTNE